jgi:hypothetical protein
MAQMESWIEWFELFSQAVNQFLCTDDRQRWYVIDCLIGIEHTALPAHNGERVDDLSIDAQQPEFKALEKTAGTRADNDDVCFNSHDG